MSVWAGVEVVCEFVDGKEAGANVWMMSQQLRVSI